MKIMLDCSPNKIKEYRAKYDVDFWQLRTPLTRYALAGVPYGLDNGCFKRFDQKTWEKLLEEAEENRPVFVCLPDIVGDAARTLDLFEAFKSRTNGLPRALVLQDGIKEWLSENLENPVYFSFSFEEKIGPTLIFGSEADRASFVLKWM